MYNSWILNQFLECLVQMSDKLEVISVSSIIIADNFIQVAEPLLPYALAFAAGAMVFVVVDDIIPEACSW